MSKLEELIEKLCPDGVEYKTLGEIATDIYRGSGIKRDQIRKIGTPCIRYGEIYTTYGIFFDSCVSYTDESLLTTKKYFEYGDILFAITGESVEDIAKSCAYVGHEKCLAGGDIVVLKHNEDPKYLSYALATADARRQKSFGKSKNKVVHSSVPALKSIKLPVPPLEVQREIVRVLDNFTFLSAELAAELAARQKQYEFYRDSLLNFNGACEDETNGNVRWMTLGDLGKWSGGKTPSMAEKSFWENGSIPWISSKDMKFNTLLDTQDHITRKALVEASMTLYPANSIAVVTRSGILKHTFPVAYIPFPTTINQDIKILVVNDEILPRYAFHLIQSKGKDILEKTKKQGGTVDSLDFQKVLAFKVLVPAKNIQQKLIDKLDRFDALCNDISSGLPAEIEARQKQYEYYCDKLLTFKELKKEA